MKILIKQLPNIFNYVQYIVPFQVSSDVTVTMILKQLYRSDDVLIDIYLNEISEDTKIITGKKVTSGGIVCLPRYDKGFQYRVDCVDMDMTGQPVRKDNIQNFYLQFTLDDGDYATE